jgi:hypothetical protein
VCVFEKSTKACDYFTSSNIFSVYEEGVVKLPLMVYIYRKWEFEEDWILTNAWFYELEYKNDISLFWGGR